MTEKPFLDADPLMLERLAQSLLAGMTVTDRPNAPKVRVRATGDILRLEIEAKFGTPAGDAIAWLHQRGQYTLTEGRTDDGGTCCDIYGPDGELIAEEISRSAGKTLLDHLNRN